MNANFEFHFHDGTLLLCGILPGQFSKLLYNCLIHLCPVLIYDFLEF